VNIQHGKGLAALFVIGNGTDPCGEFVRSEITSPSLQQKKKLPLTAALS